MGIISCHNKNKLVLYLRSATWKNSVDIQFQNEFKSIKQKIEIQACNLSELMFTSMSQ